MQKSQGGCLCSAIRYSLSGNPLHSVTCHCKTCRAASGAPSVAWLTFRRDDFQIVKGSPRLFPSSPRVSRTFCPRCGTPLTYEKGDNPSTIDITTCSMDEPGLFPPNREVWLEHRLSWEALNEQLEHYARGSECYSGTKPR